MQPVICGKLLFQCISLFWHTPPVPHEQTILVLENTIIKKSRLKIKCAVSKPPVSDIGKVYNIFGSLNCTSFTIKVGTRWASWVLSQRILFFENAIWNSQQFIILFPAYNGEFSILGKGIILVLEESFFFEWHGNSLWSQSDRATNAKSGHQISIQSPLKSVEAIPLTYVGLGSGPLWFPCSLKPSLSAESTE